MQSPDARVLRLLAEYFEPRRRLRMLNARDTIVFFGSARTASPEVANKSYRVLKSRVAKSAHPSRKLLADLESAKMDVDMAKYYEDAVELARLLTKWSKSLDGEKRFIVCSGGGPGMMEAANRGAKKAGGPSMGFNISLPFEQFPNPYIDQELCFEFHYFFMRKFWFAYLAKALVIFPGGFGTLDEFFEVLTLLQTKKISKPLSIVVYGSEYWREVINFESMIRHHMISPEDMKLFTFADTPEFAFEFLKKGLIKNYL
ncbi:MAG: LOG family protein [Bacteroidetes bacterium]|nr:LOG family protein [Bacteroidota bacterium]